MAAVAATNSSSHSFPNTRSDPTSCSTSKLSQRWQLQEVETTKWSWLRLARVVAWSQSRSRPQTAAPGRSHWLNPQWLPRPSRFSSQRLLLQQRLHLRAASCKKPWSMAKSSRYVHLICLFGWWIFKDLKLLWPFEETPGQSKKIWFQNFILSAKTSKLAFSKEANSVIFFMKIKMNLFCRLKSCVFLERKLFPTK